MAGLLSSSVDAVVVGGSGSGSSGRPVVVGGPDWVVVVGWAVVVVGRVVVEGRSGWAVVVGDAGLVVDVGFSMAGLLWSSVDEVEHPRAASVSNRNAAAAAGGLRLRDASNTGRPMMDA